MEQLVSISVFLLLAAAIVVGTGVDTYIQAWRARKHRLKDQRLAIIGKKSGRIEKYITGERRLTKTTNTGARMYLTLLVISIAGGFLFGKLVFMDTIVSLVVAAMCIVLPHAFLILKGNSDRRQLAENLESSMRIVTHEYIRTLDIQQAVSDSVDIIEYAKPFREFLIDCSMVSANVERNLRRLESKVSNIYFSRWIDQLILSESDHTQVTNLMPILDDMNDAKTAQRLNDTKVAAAWREYFTLLSIILLSPVLIRFVQYDWYLALVTTVIGKILVLAMLASLVWATGRAIKINTPITG